MDADLQAIDNALYKLNRAQSSKRSLTSCLRLWSSFIRLRDGGRCVSCHSRKRLSAHHICRKSFLSEARLLPGNGITLCGQCHKDIHAGFNGRPNLQQPMDAEGGEKIEVLTGLYGLLLDDAVEREVPLDLYYFISDVVLAKFKLLQGYDPPAYFPGSSLEQAYLIWNSAPLNDWNAILEANGIAVGNEPFLPGATITFE